MSPIQTGELNPLTLFLENHYQIQGSIHELVAYQDRNYLVTASSGEKYILKITIDRADLEFLNSQNRVLTSLSGRLVGKLLPCPIPAINGDLICEIALDGISGFARLFRYIEGQFLAETKPDISFYAELGRVFGQIDQDMAGLEDSVLKCRTHDWDLARVLEITEDIKLIDNPADRRLVHYFLMKYREEVVPVSYKLPKGLIHGDGNYHNILVSPGGAGFRGIDRDSSHHVAGVIDFGDLMWGARVNEVAIVLAYALMGRDDFMEVYREVIKGYREIMGLSDMELSILYYLVAARWCHTIVMAARQRKTNPESEYHQVSVDGACNMLHEWVRQNPSAMVIGIKTDQAEKKYQTGSGVVMQSTDEGIAERYRYFSKAVSLSYNEPIQMAGAAMQYMYGEDGATYLDCVNNIPHVGHCHPRIVEAGQRQMAILNTNTRYLYKSLDQYAGKLLSKFPPSLSKVFFVNSGSAATDLAVRLAEAHTGRRDYLVLDYAYHGNTTAAIGLSPYKFNRKGGRGKPGNVTILDLSPNAVAPTTPLFMKEGDKSPRTFFAESIVGCAGQIVLSKDLMQQTVREVRASGGIYIADEVQTGFGRVGHKYWAYELYDVVPDMVILGKPMGNGHPMGAVVCTEEIAGSFENGMEFFSSYGGNPVSCEIGTAVLEVIDEEGLQENARLVGDFLIGELGRKLAVGSGQSAVGSGQWAVGSGQLAVVRGSGLFLGIELVEPETGKPATGAAKHVVNAMKNRGFLLSTDGPFDNVIKFKPPMCFSMANAVELVTALAAEFNDHL
jgi:4-aminobutyrate aminotransferase-like enzyme/Ser/Thr protein kinase RdoA (MazF antagonist)